MTASVGEDRFRTACEWAWRTAAGTGGRHVEKWPGDLGDVPHDLADLWFRTEVPIIERLRAAQQLYRQMPCYALLMYAKQEYDKFGPEEAEAFWTEYRLLLEHVDDRLADPVAYSLWLDFFEDQGTVQHAWTECTSGFDSAAATRRIQRVLPMSGPVPYAAKRDLYDRLATDRTWHDHIARGLVGSAFDVYGDMDLEAASTLLARLEVSDVVPGMSELRQRLTSG